MLLKDLLIANIKRDLLHDFLPSDVKYNYFYLVDKKFSQQASFSHFQTSKWTYFTNTGYNHSTDMLIL